MRYHYLAAETATGFRCACGARFASEFRIGHHVGEMEAESDA